MNRQQKWEQAQNAVQELYQLENYVDENQIQIIANLRNKIQRAKALKARLQQDEMLLKREYVPILRQKLLYSQKIMNIYQLGSNIDWNNETMQRLKNPIESTKQRLIDQKNSRGTNKTSA